MVEPEQPFLPGVREQGEAARAGMAATVEGMRSQVATAVDGSLGRFTAVATGFGTAAAGLVQDVTGRLGNVRDGFTAAAAQVRAARAENVAAVRASLEQRQQGVTDALLTQADDAVAQVRAKLAEMSGEYRTGIRQAADRSLVEATRPRTDDVATRANEAATQVDDGWLAGLGRALVQIAMMQQDPLLGGFRTIILDEFHERSVHADLGIALAKQAWLARSDLRLMVMSATLDAAAVSTYLDDCPIVEVAGRSYPLDVRYAPGLSIADAVGTCLRDTSGQILCFLPGAAEIGRGHRDVAPAAEGVEIVELHGSLDAAAQDAAIAPATRRRIILRRTSRKHHSRFPASRQSSILDSIRLPVTIPSAPSTASRPNRSRRTRRTSVRAGPRGSGRAWRSGCGTSAIA